MGRKTLFNFYIDDELKVKVQEKINRLKGEENKGQVAALIRVLLRLFVETPDDKVSELLIQAIEAEYITCSSKNKRSFM